MTTQRQPHLRVGYPDYSPWETRIESPWQPLEDMPREDPAPATAFPSSSPDDDFWLSMFDAQGQVPLFLGPPSSPSDAPEDAAYSPSTPLTTISPPPDAASLFGSLPLDFDATALGLPAFHPAPPVELPLFLPAPSLLPTTPLRLSASPPRSIPPPSSFEPSPAKPLRSFSTRTLGAKKPRRCKMTGSDVVYRCDVEGCHATFHSSKRDIERHKASVHGPPVVLACGDSLSYRLDNIARHRKKCEACSAAYLRRCEEEGGEVKMRPGRKRKRADDEAQDE